MPNFIRQLPLLFPRRDRVRERERVTYRKKCISFQPYFISILLYYIILYSGKPLNDHNVIKLNTVNILHYLKTSKPFKLNNKQVIRIWKYFIIFSINTQIILQIFGYKCDWVYHACDWISVCYKCLYWKIYSTYKNIFLIWDLWKCCFILLMQKVIKSKTE